VDPQINDKSTAPGPRSLVRFGHLDQRNDRQHLTVDSRLSDRSLCWASRSRRSLKTARSGMPVIIIFCPSHRRRATSDGLPINDRSPGFSELGRAASFLSLPLLFVEDQIDHPTATNVSPAVGGGTKRRRRRLWYLPKAAPKRRGSMRKRLTHPHSLIPIRGVGALTHFSPPE
jgi:hypothetical protein